MVGTGKYSTHAQRVNKNCYKQIIKQAILKGLLSEILYEEGKKTNKF